ncbi:MAG: hypothetical protein K0R00_4151 [Herbinix sp.]|nr:hypothetical protein [Herbinix sp.]
MRLLYSGESSEKRPFLSKTKGYFVECRVIAITFNNFSVVPKLGIKKIQLMETNFI